MGKSNYHRVGDSFPKFPGDWFRWVLFLCVLHFSFVASAQGKRPQIGLTLSGGGAKGLSHIGILKAIDSAGLSIDMITGTSMGSVMGSLYAVGYTGKQIDSIARAIDWARIFSNRPPLHLVNMNEKKEFSNYALEIPIEARGKARFYSGIIEGEEIWLTFGELFNSVYSTKDFSRFNIPFRCIATDAATGKAIVLKEGEIVQAIRASMAIPSVFSAVPYGKTKLIDGGVVRNFPVQDARAMGADMVIGVNVSEGLLKADRLQSPMDMMYQIGFYKDADDFEKEKKLVNLLIEPDLSGFSAASFGSIDSLLRIGDETGRKYFPYFKHLADSLNALYPRPIKKKDRPISPRVVIDAVMVNGLQTTSQRDFEGKLGLTSGLSYSGKDLSDAVRKAFSCDNFRSIAYFLEPTTPGHASMRCEVVETLPTNFKIGLHHHSYTDIALITTLATRNLILNRSKAYLKVNWSDNLRMIVRHDQSFGQKQRWGALISGYHERFKFPLYNDFRVLVDYRSIYSYVDVKLYKLMSTTTMVGFGLSREWLQLSPKVSPSFTFNGHNSYWNGYFFLQRNSLDAKSFPRSGSYTHLQAGIIFDQKPDFQFISDGNAVTTDSVATDFHAYQQLKLKAGKYFPLGRHFTLMVQTNNGINFNYQQSFLNFYSVGGINDFIRNQVTFTGLAENQVNTNSIATFLTGIQYEPIPNFLTIFRANVGLYDFIDKRPEQWDHTNFLSGYSLSGGYRSAIGPIELSLIYSDQAKQFKGYVNLGFTF